ncbi:DUF134 domain-containing protein [Defluviitalea phaphyphila]|uniref:DUF134 domain-containing protein n=1 Tax=Defluviitalea phaphyphila TaxID=1473580 RepID=UPI000730A8F5|nr:DUF134 domain-containing protein [Defluviitalea phaphyphila]
MARPIKWRKVENIPSIQYFIPSEENVNGMPENILNFEELEAIRLKDLNGLEQGECAKKMEISRSTFQRILLSAREKIADSLVNGKIIHIEGGNFTRNICPVKCLECGEEWLERYENLEAIKDKKYSCYSCGSTKVSCNKNCDGKLERKNCWRHIKDIE